MYRFFLGLVVIARAKHPIPSRTRQLSAVAPMVLRLKTWESRSPPVLVRSDTLIRYQLKIRTVAGWSSPVARQAHNLKAAGSNPAPATIFGCIKFTFLTIQQAKNTSAYQKTLRLVYSNTIPVHPVGPKARAPGRLLGQANP